MHIPDAISYPVSILIPQYLGNKAMKILYGIDPDLCIGNPQLISQHSQDVVLPKYFYIQLLHLKNGNFESATESATKIIDSLILTSAEDLLIFQTSVGGTVYFHDQEIKVENFQGIYVNLDFSNPFDRYLLNSAKISEILDVKIIFVTSSSEVIRKCRMLNFDVATIEEFSNMSGESWLQPEMIVDIQTRLNPMAQIQWEDEETEEAQNDGNDILWIESGPSNLDLEWESN